MSDAPIRLPGRFSPEQAADIAAIQQRIFFYGWCIDHRRFEDLDEVFLPDSIIHYDTPGGTKAPWSEMREWLPKALQIFRCTQHNMHNSLIEFEADGDHARATTYGYLIHFQEKLDGEITLLRHSTIYRDQWARIDGLWRLRARTLSNVGEDGPVYQDGVRLYPEPKPL